jgi:hypothetical protein
VAGPSRLSTSTAIVNKDEYVGKFGQSTGFYMDGDEEFFRALAYMPIPEPSKPRTGILNISHKSNEFDEDFGMDDDNDFEEALSSMPIPGYECRQIASGRGNDIIILLLNNVLLP